MKRLAAVLVLLALPALAVPLDAIAGEETAESRMGLLEGEIITLDELRELQKSGADMLIFDARPKRSYDEGHIAGARLPRTADYYRQQELFRLGIRKDAPEPDAALAEGLREVPRDRPIITTCGDNCHSGAVLLIQLKQLGFQNVRATDGGLQTWEKKDYPVEKSLTRSAG